MAPPPSVSSVAPAGSVALVLPADSSGAFSPSAALSPVSPVDSTLGAHARGHRAHANGSSSSSSNGADPWSTASHNPFPQHHAVPGAQIGYFHPTRPQPLYDPLHSAADSAAFNIPSGAGQSPLPDDMYLPGGSLGSASAAAANRHGKAASWWTRKNLLTSVRSLMRRPRSRRQWITISVIAAVLALILVFLVLRAFRSTPSGRSDLTRSGAYGGRQRTHYGEGGGAGAIIKQKEEEAKAKEAIRLEVHNSAAPLLTRQQQQAAAAAVVAAAAAGSSPAKVKSSRAAKEVSLLDKGLAEIKRLKDNLKAMKAQARAANAQLAGKSADSDADAASSEESDDSTPADGDPVAVTGDVEKEIEAFKAELASKQQSDDVDEATAVAAEPADPVPTPAASDSRSQVKAPSSFDWFVSDWSDCSVSCGEGVQTRQTICQHTVTGKRVTNRICDKNEPPPKDVRECTMPPCTQVGTAATASDSDSAEVQVADAAETAPSVKSEDDEPAASPPTPASAPIPAAPKPLSWPTLAQYLPVWEDDDSKANSDAEAESCPLRRWGSAFLNGGLTDSGLNEANQVQCGVDRNPDEHASVEVVRFPRASLPQLIPLLSSIGPKKTDKDIETEQLADAFFRIKHALFHPTAVRYSSSGKGAKETVIKEQATDATATPYALSLDCTAISSLRSRRHVDPTTQSGFLRALHFLNPLRPPLVLPSDPNSKSILTRAFERMTDDEYEATTVFVHRQCEKPYSAAQCMPDLFAVFSIAHALKVEFASLRIIFLDDGDESPYFPAWQRLAKEGQVFTRTMWASLRVAPFDQDDVYVTKGVYVVPSGARTLFSLGENLASLRSPGSAPCAGLSPLHVAFHNLMADAFQGFGSHAASDMLRAQKVKLHLQKHPLVVGKGKSKSQAETEAAAAASAIATLAPHHAPPLLLVASGGGGLKSRSSDSGSVVKLHRSGRSISNLAALSSSLSAAFPVLRTHLFPQTRGLVKQITLLTHATVLLTVRNSIACNALLFVSHPQTLHVIEVVTKDESADAAAAATDSAAADSLLSLYTTQGLDLPAALARASKSRADLSLLNPDASAVFSAKWLCEKLGCASYRELVVDAKAVSKDGRSVELPVAQVQAILADLPLPMPLAPPSSSAVATLDDAAPADSDAASDSAPLEDYTPTDSEVAAEEAAIAESSAAARAEARMRLAREAELDALVAKHPLPEPEFKKDSDDDAEDSGKTNKGKTKEKATATEPRTKTLRPRRIKK